MGGTVFAGCARSLAFQGRLATVGYVDSVMKAEIDLDVLHAKRLTLFGVSNKHRDAEQRAAGCMKVKLYFRKSHCWCRKAASMIVSNGKCPVRFTCRA